MIELARHIEYLLLHNDRVSVPGLGVFTVTYREARLLPDGSSFLPPVRSIGFLPGETGDDERLLRSVMRAGFLSYDEAREALDGEVDSIRRAIEADGEYRLGRLGRFVQRDGGVRFCADEANFVEYPRFGFAPVEVNLLEEPEVENEVAVVEEAKTPDRIYISFPRRTLRAVAVAAAVIVFLLMLSKPVHTPDTTVNYAGLLSAELFGTANDTAQLLDEGDVPDTRAESQQTAPAAKETTVITADAPATADTYYIIVSSLPSKRLAEKQIECFRQQGVACDLHIYETARKARLYVASFNNFEEARQYLSQLVKEQPLFENAWIMNARD